MNEVNVHRGTWARGLAVAALSLVLLVSGVVWLSPRPAIAGPRALPGAAAPPAGVAKAEEGPARGGKKAVTGKLNLNTATIEQLVMLPGIGPSKAERIVAWRGKHGPFRRVQDLRKVKGFGYKTLKKLEAHLDVKGESTLAPAS